MASFVRVARQGCRILNVAKHRQFVQNNVKPIACCISTSKKNKDAATISITEKIQTPAKIEENLEEKEENWIAYGYNLTDREEDEWQHHMSMFVGITLCLVGGGYFLTYFPDLKARDWGQREGFLELARRENAGLPYVDANLIDPVNIELPSDEELGDTEIII